jgi:hypothetical protein
MIGGPRLQIAEGQNNLRYLENVVRLPIRDLQGVDDDPLLVWNLDYAFGRLIELGATDAALVMQKGHGHSFDLSAVNWPEFFEGARREPWPDRVVLRAAAPGATRSFWCEVLATAPPTAEVFAPRVDPKVWNRASAHEKRRLQAADAEAHTARIEAERVGKARYQVRHHGVRRFRLYLRPDDFPADARTDERTQVEIVVNGRRRMVKVAPSLGALLRDFLARADSGHLPFASVDVE